MAKTDWLDSDGNLNPDNFWSDSNIDWEELKKHAYITPDWVRHPERYPELMKRMQEWHEKYKELLNARTTEDS